VKHAVIHQGVAHNSVGRRLNNTVERSDEEIGQSFTLLFYYFGISNCQLKNRATAQLIVDSGFSIASLYRETLVCNVLLPTLQFENGAGDTVVVSDWGIGAIDPELASFGSFS
jgi:hypothetical protein